MLTTFYNTLNGGQSHMSKYFIADGKVNKEFLAAV